MKKLFFLKGIKVTNSEFFFKFLLEVYPSLFLLKIHYYFFFLNRSWKKNDRYQYYCVGYFFFFYNIEKNIGSLQ